MEKSIFQSRLKQLRKKSGLTQKETADALGIPSPTYSGYENGNRTPDMNALNTVADYFNVSIDYLFGRVNNPDIAILNDLPEELRVEGIKAVYAVKEAVKTGLSADEINDILVFAKKIKHQGSKD